MTARKNFFLFFFPSKSLFLSLPAAAPPSSPQQLGYEGRVRSVATGGERGGAVVQEATLPTLLFSLFYPCALRLTFPPPWYKYIRTRGWSSGNYLTFRWRKCHHCWHLVWASGDDGEYVCWKRFEIKTTRNNCSIIIIIINGNLTCVEKSSARKSSRLFSPDRVRCYKGMKLISRSCENLSWLVVLASTNTNDLSGLTSLVYWKYSGSVLRTLRDREWIPNMFYLFASSLGIVAASG